MYSIVLVMALQGGAASPVALGHGCDGCHGWRGCHGGRGCHGWGGHGCHGWGGCHGGRGCHGWGGHGCWGGGHGCNGWGHGSNGWGHGCNGFDLEDYGCFGVTCAGWYATHYHGCYRNIIGGECWGCYAVSPYAAHPRAVLPPKKAVQVKPSTTAAPAVIVVRLPADARLMFENKETESTSALRTFTSPVLEPGKPYYYTLRAEAVRDGVPVTASRRIAVRAGEETEVSLDFSLASVARQ